MSTKIKLSYTTEEELQSVIRLLSPVVKSWKVSKNQDGKYRKAYIELDVVKRGTERNKKEYVQNRLIVGNTNELA